MAKRYSGDLTINVAYTDLGDYRVSVSKSGKPIWKGRIGPPASGFGPGIGYDSERAYDRTAHAALSFADDETGRVVDSAELDPNGTWKIRRVKGYWQKWPGGRTRPKKLRDPKMRRARSKRMARDPKDNPDWLRRREDLEDKLFAKKQRRSRPQRDELPPKGQYKKIATATSLDRLQRYINEYAYSSNYRIDPKTLRIANPLRSPPPDWFVARYRRGYLFGVRTTAGDPARRGRHRRKGAPTFKQQAFISRKIRNLRREGYPSDQAAAIAYRMAGVPPLKTRKRQT